MMLRRGASRLGMSPITLRAPDTPVWRVVALLALLAAIVGSTVALAVGPNAVPASAADQGRTHEIEALFASLRQAAERCSPASRER